MKRLALTLAISLAFGSAAGVAQDALQQAREDGKEFGKAKRAESTDLPSQGQLNEVPGYSGTDLPQSAYFDDPDRLGMDGVVQASGSEAYQTVTDQSGTRPAFTNQEILTTTERATDIAENPDTYLAGEQLGGSAGTCVPLPPGAGQKGYYEATCNKGTKIEDRSHTCTIRMVPEVTTVEVFKYLVVPDNAYGTPLPRQSNLAPHVSSGVCKPTGSTFAGCTAHDMFGASRNKFCDDFRATEYSCTQNITGVAFGTSPKTGGEYWAKDTQKSVVVRRVDGCGTLGSDSQCTASGGEVCSEPGETRVIDGVSVTEACWAWTREFMCRTSVQATDCTDLEGDAKCSFLREECLDDPQEGECKVSQRVYSCPLPNDQAPGDKQYICGDDVYCINGNCETIEREASTEFKDALVALNALGQAGKEFDPDKLTVFSGERDTCSKKIFGASNCCSGKGVPLLTPWLCSSAEKELDEKDDKGLCHKVGSYCADSILGVCVTSKDAYCCFGSKISRILQVQGRQQIGKPWDKPKNEKCEGFTIQEFQRLDLSQMDFSEVYAEFIEAAKLPDEVETLADIQRKIQDYYDLHAGQ